MYLDGAIENAKSVKKYYPEFIARFYVSKSIPEKIVEALKNEGAEVFIEDDLEGLNAMIWRFYVFADEDVELAIIRDADSRLSMREAAAVNEWLESGKSFHIMRDHIRHGVLMLGGMWGARAAALRDIKERLVEFRLNGLKGADQNFLYVHVYDLAKNDSCVHTSHYRWEKHARPFPTKRAANNSLFVGQVIEDGKFKYESETVVSTTIIDKFLFWILALKDGAAYKRKEKRRLAEIRAKEKLANKE